MSVLLDNMAIIIGVAIVLVLGFIAIKSFRDSQKIRKKVDTLKATLKVDYSKKLKEFATEFPDHNIHSEGYLYGSHYEIFLISSKNELKMNLTDYSLDPRDEKDARALKMLRAILEMRFDKYDLSIQKREVLREVWIELHRGDKEQGNAGLTPVSA